MSAPTVQTAEHDSDNTFTSELAPIFTFCAQSMHWPQPSWLNDAWFTALSSLLDALEAEEERQQIYELATRSDFIEALQVEHTRLFINATPHLIAPLWGSVYLEKTLYGRFGERVEQYYREHGLSLPADSDFPDHLVYLLEYSAFAVENGQPLGPFLHRFFHPWFGEFASRVNNGAALPFYPVIISLIEFFTKEEKRDGD